MTLTLELLCVATSLLSLWKMGDKSVWGPILGLLSQVAWGVFIVVTGHWGFAPGWVVFVTVHARNLRKWRKEPSGIPVRFLKNLPRKVKSDEEN